MHEALREGYSPWGTGGTGGTAHDGEGATSQLDPPSLTLLSVAGCDRVQLGVPHLATAVDYCK